MYILKQIHNPTYDEQFLLITDAIASTIGVFADVHVNYVAFVPYTVGAHLKVYPERAATLHTYMSGKDLESFAGTADTFTLHQRIINPDSSWQKQFPLTAHQQGLTKDIIESMTCNDNLPAIVALDTFVGNIDRSLPNIFYDANTNSFGGIDQAATLTRDLSLFAFEQLQELISGNYFASCPFSVYHGITIYRDTLSRLVHNNTPQDILQDMVKLADFLGKNSLKNNEVQARLGHHKKIIEQSYISSLRLIELLNFSFGIPG